MKEKNRNQVPNDRALEAQSGSARAEKFIALINQKGWSQSLAAQELQITRNHVNMILNGKATPSAALLALLEEKLKRTEELDPRLAEINDYLKTLNPSQKEKVLECLDSVVNLQRQSN